MEKNYYLFAGVNGAGKTTLYETQDLNNLGIRINNDEILRNAGGDWKKQDDQVRALLTAIHMIKECVENGKSFNHETILTGNSYSFVKNIRDKNYKIYLYYVGVDNVDIAIKRVKERERKGGHGISEEDIRRRYVESLDNLVKIISLCDVINIYDNTKKLNE